MKGKICSTKYIKGTPSEVSMMAFVIMGTDGVLFQHPPPQHHQLKFHTLNSPQNTARQQILGNTRIVCLYTTSLLINPLCTSSFGPTNQEECEQGTTPGCYGESRCHCLVTRGLSGLGDTLPISSDIIVIVKGLLIIFSTMPMSQNMTTTYR